MGAVELTAIQRSISIGVSESGARPVSVVRSREVSLTCTEVVMLLASLQLGTITEPWLEAQVQRGPQQVVGMSWD